MMLSIFILGLIHGLTPDEHTWPMLFSFVLSERKWTKGVLAAVSFILPATLVWAGISGFSGFLGSVFWKESLEIYMHFILGVLMIIFGFYIFRFLKIPHLHLRHHHDEKVEGISLKQLSVYGFFLGLCPCVPVLILYGLSAKLHNFSYGILAGVLFGLGTMVSLSILGGFLGGILQFAEEKSQKDLSKVCAKLSGFVLIVLGVWLIVSVFLESF
jgi:sulfite exporter TauE/SafE